MNDDGCVIEVNGNNYFVPCDRIDYLIVEGNSLVNVGSSTINLYSEFLTYNDSSSGYPRIICNSNTKCVYRQSYNSNVSALNVNNVSIANRNLEFSFLLNVVIVGVLICQLFKH